MLKKDFWFELPQRLIAQQPAVPRDAARLLCIDRQTGALAHHIFHELPALLHAGTCWW